MSEVNYPECLRDLATLSDDALRHLGRGAQFIPQGIRLVEDDHHATAFLLARALDEVLPYLQVRVGDPGVRSQYEQYCLGRWQHLVGEFGFAADGVQARGVEDTQSLFQQRVPNVELRQSSAWDAHVLVVCITLILEQAEFCSLARADQFVLGQHLQ